MKGPLNPPLNVGDKVICYHMDGETSVPPGTKGVVKSVVRDPFESGDEYIYNVEWENGNNLGLISATDAWKKVNSENIKEQIKSDDSWDFITKNEDLFEHFDWRWFRDYLYKIRESGIVNMFSSAPLLYSGKEHIDRYYGEGREDEDTFKDVLDNANIARDKMIQGILSYMDKHDKDVNNDALVNRCAKDFSQKLLKTYIKFIGYKK